MKRSVLKRSPLRPSGPVRRVNRKRRERLFTEDFHSAEYVAFVHAQQCAICGIRGYSDAAHIRSRGAGGKANMILPLCRPHYCPALVPGCHWLWDNHLLDADKDELLERAKAMYEAWLVSQKVG